MTQEEIVEFLEKNKGEWFTAEEIAKEIGRSKGATHICLRKLRRSRLVAHRPNPQKTLQHHYSIAEI